MRIGTENRSQLPLRLTDIDVIATEPPGEFVALGPISARCTAATLLSQTPTVETVNARLREVAQGAGASAVMRVSYDRGISATSWKALTASGVAMVCRLPIGVSSTPADVTTAESIALLERLAQLHASGALTDAEFEAKKTDLLKRL